MSRSVANRIVALLAIWTISASVAAAACAPDCPTHPFPAQFSDPELFRTAIAAAERRPVKPTRLSGVTLPHHILAADLMARAMQMVDGGGLRRAVILFPDHFRRTALPFATTRRDFETVFGL